MKRPSKYHATKTELDGITFDSKAESKRYAELKLLYRAHLISDIELQPKFPMIVNGVKVCTYIADFMYIDTATGETIAEDVKGCRTPVYSIKQKLFAACYPTLKLVEVSA
jgi:hypothetical protein